MVAHAAREAPRECCGLLIGRRGRVAFTLPMPNADPRPRTGFRVDPAEHIAARRVLRRLVPALDIVGVYHSHPSSAAVPSPRDLAEAHYPEWLFVIVGNAAASVRVFRITDGMAAPVRVRWTGAAAR
jgi:desampylase